MSMPGSSAIIAAMIAGISAVGIEKYFALTPEPVGHDLHGRLESMSRRADVQQRPARVEHQGGVTGGMMGRLRQASSGNHCASEAPRRIVDAKGRTSRPRILQPFSAKPPRRSPTAEPGKGAAQSIQAVLELNGGSDCSTPWPQESFRTRRLLPVCGFAYPATRVPAVRATSPRPPAAELAAVVSSSLRWVTVP